MYCIGELTGQDGRLPVQTEGRLTARSACEAGYQLVLQKVHEAKERYHAILTDFCDYGSEALRDTLTAGMPKFFLYYDARYRPQNHILTLDYPVIGSLEESRGIDRIDRYLSCLSLEQQFLGWFDEQKVREYLLCFHDDYETLFINVCAQVLRGALACLIAGRPVPELCLYREDMDRIAGFVLKLYREEKSGNELMRELRLRILGITGKNGDSQKELGRYLMQIVPDFTAELINAAEHDCMEALFGVRK
ncbi:DUF6179 domain-containing protein [Anaerolentibacter hominis]|uniref:DUF6179 domain-containing protein n=1 Tax=Anaerolentibacter hominis TaxID=3079009 RepID=UPI0031B88427